MITLTESGRELKNKALSIPDAIQGDACLNSTEFEALLGQFKGLLAKVHETNLNTAKK